jgi:hypothetical protein
MGKKIKTPMSEFIHQHCVIPERKKKNEAIKQNKPFEAGLAAIAERNCKNAEEFFKWKKPN